MAEELPQKLVSKAELARMLGVSRAAVTKALATYLAGCETASGAVDANLKPVRDALARRRANPNPTPSELQLGRGTDGRTRNGRNPFARSDPDPDGPSSPDAILAELKGKVDESSLEEIGTILSGLVEKYGSLTGMEKLVDIARTQQTWLKLKIGNDEKRGDVIARDGVSHIFGLIDTLTNRLLRDVPRNLSGRVLASAKSGATADEIESMIRDAISSVLNDVVDEVARRLERGPSATVQ